MRVEERDLGIFERRGGSGQLILPYLVRARHELLHLFADGGEVPIEEQVLLWEVVLYIARVLS